MMSMLSESRRISSTISSPAFFGMTESQRTRSKDCCWNLRTPSAPSPAVSTSWPPDSRMARMTARTSSSSSMTRMRAKPLPSHGSRGDSQSYLYIFRRATAFTPCLDFVTASLGGPHPVRTGRSVDGLVAAAALGLQQDDRFRHLLPGQRVAHVALREMRCGLRGRPRRGGGAVVPDHRHGGVPDLRRQHPGHRGPYQPTVLLPIELRTHTVFRY